MDPLIFQKLQAFARRRRRLIVLRGICSALAMLLATMMAVALLDRIFIMPDWLRWSLSGVAYVAVLITEWRACVRLLLHLPGPRQVARLVEQTAPELREDLLSAVELGEGDARFDSPIFRSLLQTSVARRMAGLDAQHLLPLQLLRRSFLWLAAVGALMGAAFYFAGQPFAAMLLRALLPMANLARISTIQVQILAPSPAEMPVPQGDTVPLAIQISGGHVEKAYLETFSRSSGRNLIQMGATGHDLFGSSVQIAREDVEYRVRAGDAITRKFRLHAAARPHVLVFHKSYQYPAYTQLPVRTVGEENGDLAAVEGTEVDLQLETDQPVRSAELRLETSQSSSTVPLQKGAGGRWHTKVPLSGTGIYRVHLVAEETGFENKFSPEYELRADPDLIPRVELEVPQQDVIASNRQTLEIAGTATDDLAVATVEQLYKVNDKPWKSIRLPAKPGPQTDVRNLWDLAQEHLRAGDQITTKLAATDQKGNRGESRPVQITLVESGFDPHRAETVAEWTKLWEAANTLRGAAETLDKRAEEARKESDKGPEKGPLPAGAWAAWAVAMDQAGEFSSAVSAQLLKTLPKTEPGGESGTLMLIGRALARTELFFSNLRGVQQATADPAVIASETPVRRDLVHEAGDTAHHYLEACRRLEELCRLSLGAEEMSVACENLQVLWQDEKPLEEAARRTTDKDAVSWSQIASHYRVVLAEAVQVEDDLKSAGSHLNGGLNDRAQRDAKKLQEQHAELAKAVTAAKPDKAVVGAAHHYASAVADTLNSSLDVARESEQRALGIYREVRQDMQPTWTTFERLRQDCEAVLHNERLPAGVQGIEAEARWVGRTSLWKEYGDWEEVRPDADNYFVQSLRALVLALPDYHGAVTSLAKEGDREAMLNQFTSLQTSLRVLECVHDLNELAGGCDALAAEERWESTSLRARTAGPAAWFWVQSRLRTAADEIARTEPAQPEGRKALQEAQQILGRIFQNGPGNALDAEMQQRYNKERAPIAQERPSRAVAARIRDALKLLQPAKEAAEHTLAELAPKLAERMAQLAKEAAELQKHSEEHAKETAQATPENTKAEARQELAAQQKLNEQVDAVKDAIRNDAQRQNLMKEEGRERARDADDALAILRDPPPRAEQALADAAAGQKPEEQKDALHSAAEEQGKLASALEELAKHYDALDQGKGEETRMALREQEKAMGLKPNLDRQFAQAEQMAKTAEGTPEQMLKKLEEALPANPIMREELSNVAKEVLNAATQKLAMASGLEDKVAKGIDQLAAEQAHQAAEAAKANPPATPPGNQPPPAAGNPPPAKGSDPANQPPAGAKPDGAKPDGAKPDGAKPDGAKPDGAKPDGAKPDGAKPDGAKPDGAKPDGAKPDGAKPDGAKPDGAKPDAANPAGAQPDGTNPSGSKPDGSPSDGATPDGANPDGASPGAPPSPMLAQAAAQQPQIADSATQAGQEVERAGRHEERLNHPQTGQQLERLGRQVQETGANDVPKAGDALQKARAAAQAQAPVGQANDRLKGELARLSDAAADASNATIPSDGAPAPNPAAPNAAAMAQNASTSPGATPPAASPDGAAPGTPPPSGTPPSAGTPPPGGAQPGQPPTPPAGSQPAVAAASPGEASPPPAGSPAGAAPGAPPPPAGQGAPPPATPGSQPAMASGGQPPASPGGTPPPGSDESGSLVPPAGTAATPQQQTWMARALDLLDSALHAQANPLAQQNGEKGEPAGQPKGQSAGQAQAQSAQEAMEEAQQAMNSAAQAAAAAMRAGRSQPPSQSKSAMAKSDGQEKSENGAEANAEGISHGSIPAAQLTRNGDWGKLPKKMAEQLNQGQREGVASEYKNQVETYYRVIAERAKKP